MTSPAENFNKKITQSKTEKQNKRKKLIEKYKKNPKEFPKKLLFRGFNYYLSKIHPTSGNYYYRCINRKEQCKARFTFYTKTFKITITQKAHINLGKNCKPLENIKKTTFAPDFDNIISEMVNEKKTTKEIFTNLIKHSEKNNTTLAPFLTQNQIKNKIKYQIQSERPTNTLEKITFGKELTHEGFEFLQIYQEVLFKMISWSSFELINVMRSSTHLFVDGTFLSAPNTFSQLIILSVYDIQTNCFVVTNYSLIDSKFENNYDNLFFQLFQKIPNFCPQFITCDFEKAKTNSLQKKVPKSKIIHCYFHFTQCLVRRIRTTGNKNNKELIQIFEKLKKFVHLNPQLIFKKWKKIYLNNDDSKIENFLNYFYKFFFKQHPPVTWNVSSFCKNIMKTNAFLEGNNALLNKIFNHKKPTLENFIIQIRKLENESMLILRDQRKRKSNQNQKFNYSQFHF
ncbi:hypothetical protein M0812_25632 [Anaeramoeba flamelloides]|uniref:MULE transposase domain-containing protein n=1 Tax=Anaeramoeba flamelloides TaxID=1746091 RepID=A0AAV7YGI6_9EUKA|nr:hypothetical protein M0812_25632 [Anaeramoeba flamelloides]